MFVYLFVRIVVVKASADSVTVSRNREYLMSCMDQAGGYS